VGGGEAIHKITTREAKGETIVADRKSPIELYMKAPNLRVSISKMGDGESYTAFDGTAGWMGNTGREPRDMSAEESWAAGMDAEFALPLRLKEIFPQLRRGRSETINGEECEVLTGTARGHAPVRFDFSTKTGLLMNTEPRTERARPYAERSFAPRKALPEAPSSRRFPGC
jgi:photosynthetic reaction center cytochrome c subunit